MDYNPKTFDWWKAKLSGNDVPMHADQPMQGYYAYKPSAKARPLPVAIWYVDGELHCKVGSEKKSGVEYWTWVMRNPIQYAVYINVMNGNPWPEEIVIEESGDSTMLSNQSDDDEQILSNIEEWTDRARRAVKKGKPETKVDADALSDLATKLVDLCNEANERRVAAVRPHLEAQRVINGKYKGRIDPAERAVRDLKTFVGIWQQEERKRQQEAAGMVRQAAMAGGAPVDIKEREINVRTGTRGKSITMVNRTVVAFEEDGGIAKAMAFIAGLDAIPPAVVDAVTKAAFNLLQAGVTVPGASLKKEQVAR